ncbi:LysR substrate-binding domain-containing protein [Azospirillum halopraeferens]|uniref:LysR substrate-binding domain-containing protein n=1 Tax=Azospirillum halopraeferens TaxID=34010 RepID=UPI00041D3076|nr:LysR substrate-binding domain-containing protein [Azospirillum halopraeferens]
MDHLDPDLLKTFLAFVDGGTLNRAAAAVGRSPSAVTAQMQRLEEIVGEPLLLPAGRGRVLTDAGQELAGHARRILEMHRAALMSLRGGRAGGTLTVAATQDVAEHGLPPLLRLFARTHARVRLHLRVGRTADLTAAFEAGGIDVMVAMRLKPAPDEVGLIREPMVWLTSADGPVRHDGAVPLALLDPPCGFRDAALAALERAGRRYRIAATSQSLSGLRAAVGAGIAVTLRTARWCGAGIAAAPPGADLPEAGEAVFAIRVRAGAGAAAGDLGLLLAEGLRPDAPAAPYPVHGMAAAGTTPL